MVGWEEGTDEVVHQGECGLPARPDLAVADHPIVVFGKDEGPAPDWPAREGRKLASRCTGPAEGSRFVDIREKWTGSGSARFLFY